MSSTSGCSTACGRPRARSLGALIGVAGVAFLFADQLAATAVGGGSALGLLLSLGGTYCFSLGNLVSRPAAEAAGDLPNAIARAMTWGAALLAVVVAARGLSFAPSTEPVYVGALLYLAAVGSALASSPISRWSPASVRSAPPIRRFCRR